MHPGVASVGESALSLANVCTHIIIYVCHYPRTRSETPEGGFFSSRLLTENELTVISSQMQTLSTHWLLRYAKHDVLKLQLVLVTQVPSPVSEPLPREKTHIFT